MLVLNFRLLASALALSLAITGVSTAGTPDDAQILGIYIQVNTFDVETALLGQSQGGAAVRDLAAHVASDHLGVRQAAWALATQCGVTPSLPASRASNASEHDAKLKSLLLLRGDAFDRAYVRHEVAFHHAAIDAVRGMLLPAAKCPALQAHLQQVLPAFEQHLEHTEMLAHELGVQ
jgi:putative membrane protein